MLTLHEALQKILDVSHPIGTQEVSLLDAVGRSLAENVRAGEDLPPFDRSPLDGYALKAADTTGVSGDNPATLTVVGTLPAGSSTDTRVNEGEAIRIMTGAPIPRGADCVVRQENTQIITRNQVAVFEELRAGDNLVKAGEDVKKGAAVLTAEKVLTPPDIGLLAALGLEKVRVFKRPRVQILATGDELVDVSQKLAAGKIRNSNSYMLASLIKEYGGEPTLAGIASDNLKDLEDKIENSLNDCDILMTTGGVSVGDYDLLPEVLERIGATRLFWKVGIKPGTPLLVAEKHGKLIFAFSGNPAACLVTFEQFAGPSLLKIQGRKDCIPQWTPAALADNITVKKTSQVRFIRAHCKYNGSNKLEVAAADKQKPGVLSSFRDYNCYIVLREGADIPRKGENVNITLTRRLLSYGA